MRLETDSQWAETRREALELIKKHKNVSLWCNLTDCYMPVTKKYLIDSLRDMSDDAYQSESVFYSKTWNEVRIG